MIIIGSRVRPAFAGLDSCCTNATIAQPRHTGKGCGGWGVGGGGGGRTKDGHDLHGGEAGLAGGARVEGGEAHEAVRAPLPTQPAIRVPPRHLHLHALHPRLLP